MCKQDVNIHVFVIEQRNLMALKKIAQDCAYLHQHISRVEGHVPCAEGQLKLKKHYQNKEGTILVCIWTQQHKRQRQDFKNLLKPHKYKIASIEVGQVTSLMNLEIHTIQKLQNLFPSLDDTLSYIHCYKLHVSIPSSEIPTIYINRNKQYLPNETRIPFSFKKT